MRELAAEAGVSFATPFNHFGSKAAIMLALSGRRIALVHDRLAQATMPPTAVGRVLAAFEIAATIVLAAPTVNRAVMAAICAPSAETGDVSLRSSSLWAEALGTGEGLTTATLPLGLVVIPELSIAFRGVLSFWTAGELADKRLTPCTRAAAATVLLGFVARDDRLRLLAILEQRGR